MTLPATRRQSLLAHLLLLAVVVVWGVTFPLVKSALRDSSPLLFNQLRMLLAFAVLAIVHVREWRQITWPSVWAGALSGVLLAAGYEFQTAGLALTTPSKSAFLTGAIVVLVPILCLLQWIRPEGVHAVGLRTAPGVVLAFLGIALLTVPAKTPVRELFSSMQKGDLLTLCCALAFALHLLSLAHNSRKVPIGQLATLQIGFCALCMTVATPMVEHTYLHPTARLFMTLGLCAVLATAAAFTIQSWAQKHLPATHTALLLSLEPVFAWAVSLSFYGERLTMRSSMGSLLIFAGILVTEFGFPIGNDANAAPPA